MDGNGWLGVKAASRYCCVSPRTIRAWIAEESLKHSRVRGLILIKVKDLNEFIENFSRKIENREVKSQKLLDQILADL